MSMHATVNGNEVAFTCHSGRLIGTELPNHLDGIRSCLEAEAYRIEIDIHSIEGNDYLVSHASRLEDSTTSRGSVGGLTREAALRLKRNDARGDRPPLLSDVVTLMSGSSTHLQLDLKDWRPLTKTRVEVLSSLTEQLGDRVLVSSGQDWNLRALAAYRSGLRLGFDPDHYVAAQARKVPIPARLGAYAYRDDHPLAIGRSQSVQDYWRERVGDLVAKCPSAGEFFVEYHLVLQALDDGVSIADLLHERDISLSVWTVDYVGPRSLETVGKLAEAGVDRITTNTAERFRTALAG